MGEKRAKGRTDNQNKSDECSVRPCVACSVMMEGVLSDLMEIIPCGCWHITQSQSILQIELISLPSL